MCTRKSHFSKKFLFLPHWGERWEWAGEPNGLACGLFPVAIKIHNRPCMHILIIIPNKNEWMSACGMS